MSARPSDIPESVWEEAHEPAEVVFDASVDLYETGDSAVDIRLVIARAILAAEKRGEERERELLHGQLLKQIAHAIRNPSHTNEGV